LKSAFAIAFVCIFACAVTSFAQTSNSTIGGTVSDASGALIPGVTVTATNIQTGIVNNTVTNESGAYQFASLQPGTYKLSAELPGFQSRTYNDVSLGSSTQLRLNFSLQVAGGAQSVDVNVAVDTLLATSSASVGGVLPEYKVRDLPLAARSVLDLTQTTAGTEGSNFAGARVGQVSTRLNGVNVDDGRYQNGVYSATVMSADLIDEVHVIVAPADAETGRGSGQVQASMRAGTNQFRGSLFWINRNSALDSNSWFNNFKGLPVNYINRNDFGGRIGGPIIKNKTFFFFLYEGQREAQRTSVTNNVWTDSARQGNFRYFPGVQSANALQANSTVDLRGNPILNGQPATPSLFSVFTKDSLRTGFDPTGYIKKVIGIMPAANDFTVGDGLNTAGFTWTQHSIGAETPFSQAVDVPRNQYNVRLDHNFSSNNKVFFTMSREHTWADSQNTTYPAGYHGLTDRTPRVYTSSFVSTLSPTILNEARFGLRIGSQDGYAAYDTPAVKSDLFNFLPKAGGVTYLPLVPVGGSTNNVTNQTVGSRTQRSPLYQFGDTLSWTHGKHAFKGGAEFRSGWSRSMQADGGAVPLVNFGAGGQAISGINSTAIPGLSGPDQTSAQNLLNALAGSVSTVQQAFFLNDSKDLAFKSAFEQTVTPPGKYRENHQRESSAFFKDDWKVRQNLTLNIGLRWDYYGVPWEKNGLAGTPIGQGTGLFGVSGTGFADMFQPGHLAGSLTTVQLVGKNSPHPGQQMYKDDWNNFGPAVGLSWNLPWLGKDKTVLRVGYGVSYQGGGRAVDLDRIMGGVPGADDPETFSTSNYLDLTKITLPLQRAVPFQPVPLTDRTKGIEAFDPNTVTPYVQNWNLEIQRELAKNLTVEVRYVGSKGTRLYGETPLNEVNVFENGILDAFKITRAGLNASLFDKMLNNINIGGGATTVNGTTETGSMALRQNATTRTQIANGDVGAFAAFLNSTTVGTNVAGGLLRTNGFAENFIVVNPQFNTALSGSPSAPYNALLNWNPGNSTYHSMQLQVTKRLSQGFTNQTSWTWSRTIGEADADTNVQYRTLRNRSLNKQLLGFHRTYDFRSNGTFDLPFGPNRSLLANAPHFVSRIVERWQLGGIFGWTSGAPLSLSSSRSAFNQITSGPPNIVGNFPKSLGGVKELPGGVVNYLSGFTQVTDPSVAGVTALQSTQGSFTAKAIRDANGNLVLVNAQPGDLGTLGLKWIEGPANLHFDVNVIKRVRITEQKEFELRVDALNVLNHPIFGNPTLDINNASFGRITTATGTRSFTINTRLNF
jgi:hypothetical protein